MSYKGLDVEYVVSSSETFTAWPVATNVIFDLTSIVLVPGEWDITGVTAFNNNGAVTAGNATLAITTTAGNSGTGFIFQVNRVSNGHPATSGYNTTLVVPNYRVVVTASAQTFYLKAVYDQAITNLRYLGYRISARRIR